MDCAWTLQVSIFKYDIIYSLTIFIVDNLYIGDFYNNRVRKVAASTSVISTIAGTGTAGYSGDDGPATIASLNHPVGVAVDASGKPNLIAIFHLMSADRILYRQCLRQ